MEFVIDTRDFQGAIKSLGVSAKQNVEDTSGRVLIEVYENNTVKFFSSDGPTAVEIVTPADVTTPGEAVINYGKLTSFISPFSPWKDSIGTKNINVKTDSSAMHIFVESVFENGKTSTSNLSLGTYTMFGAPIPQPFDQEDFIINSLIYKKALSKTVYAIDRNTKIEALRGMNINFDGDKIHFVGSDGKTISEYTIKNSTGITEGSHILKHSFIMGLRRALSEETQLFFDVNSDDTFIKVKFDNICFWGRKTVGREYPKYRHFFENYEHVVKIEKSILVNAVLSLHDLLDATDDNRLRLSVKDGKVITKCNLASFECDTNVDYNGMFDVDINGSFLKNSIMATNDDMLLMKFTDSKGPVIFDSSNFEDQKSFIGQLNRRD